MSCRFYGKNGMYGTLIDTNGNQCALRIDAHSPCLMENLLVTEPDEKTCPYIKMVRSQYDLLKTAGLPELKPEP